MEGAVKQLQIRIFPDGKIESKTVNIKGKECISFINSVEKMTGAKVFDSEFTAEYYENINEEQIAEEQYERIGKSNE